MMQRACATGVILCVITACTSSGPQERDAFKSPGETPLHAAVKIGDREVVRALLNSGADPNAMEGDGETPLHHAVRSDRVEIAEMLLIAGADPNARTMNGTPLHGAAHYGASLVVGMLLAAGADPNAKNDLGWTPLHELALSNSPDTVAVAQMLIEAGADASSKDWNGATPLDRANKYNRSVIAQYLAEIESD